MIVKLFLAALLSVFVGAVAGYIGSLMLTKRMALIGGPLGHLALPGMSLALAYNIDVSLGALAFLIFGTALIWLVYQKTKLPMEAVTAIVFSSSLSIAFLVLPRGKTKPALLGDLSQISLNTVIITIIVSTIIFLIIRYLYKNLLLMSISSDLAKSTGINTKINDFLFLTCIGIVVAMGVRIVGGLMTAALIAIPACTSRNISSGLLQYAYISLTVGAISSLSGVLLATIFGLPSGPMIIIFSAFLFLISMFVKPKFLDVFF
jgi:zinc transport system permease protein